MSILAIKDTSLSKEDMYSVFKYTKLKNRIVLGRIRCYWMHIMYRNHVNLLAALSKIENFSFSIQGEEVMSCSCCLEKEQK